jgi:hypothetical protein
MAMPFGRDRSFTPSSPLAGVAYGRRSRDLARFVEDPVDAIIAQIVADASGLRMADRESFRSAVTAESAYSLLVFACRRAVSAMRETSLPQAMEAIHALTVVDRSKIDFRDLSVDFPLYAVRELGGDPEKVAAMASSLSERGTADCFTARAKAALTISLRECALLEVESRYGLGYMDVRTRAYEPTTNLAAAAIRLADLIDAEGQYIVNDLWVADLPSVWFDLSRTVASVPTSGCVSFSASLEGSGRWSHGLLVFVAEVGTQLLAAELATRAAGAATPERPSVATVQDRRMVLIVGGSTTAGEYSRETGESLIRFQASVLEALGPSLP